MSKKNKKNKKKKNNIQNNSKSNQLKEQPNNAVEKTDYEISQELKDTVINETVQDNTNQESTNNTDKISNTEKSEKDISTDDSSTISPKENDNIETDTSNQIPIEDATEKDISTDDSSTISPKENDNIELDTSNQTPIEDVIEKEISIDNTSTVSSEENDNIETDTSNQMPIEDSEYKSNVSKPEQQTKEEKNKTKSHKNKRILAICATTALISSLISITAIKLIQTENTPKSDNVFIEDIESMISAEEIGKKLETKKLIDSNTMFTIDYTFDSRFELFKDNILEVYTKVSNSDENFEEVFIIKNNNTERVEECLNVYKANLINRYENNKDFKKTLDIVEKAIINSEKGITYFIASNKKEDIEKMIIKEINI